MKLPKIISIYSNEKALIGKAMAGNRKAQQWIYNRYAPKMLGVCRQYIGDLQFAEDVMINGFVKVFQNLEGFANRGSFEGWIRRIMINEAITYLRKKQFVVFDSELYETTSASEIYSHDNLLIGNIQQLIDSLPEGYKMVFVLYTVEGYKHREIAEMLAITIGTSKSQLFKARKILQDKIRKMERVAQPLKVRGGQPN